MCAHTHMHAAMMHTDVWQIIIKLTIIFLIDKMQGNKLIIYNKYKNHVYAALNTCSAQYMNKF